MSVWQLIVASVLLALLLIAVVNRFGGVDRADPWVKFLQGVITCVAIILAGYLYLVERRNKPHADVTQAVQAVDLGANNVMIEASITVKNLGTQLLHINHVNSKAQTLDLASLGKNDLPQLQEDAYWLAVGRPNGRPRPVFNGTELRWRQLKFYDGPADYEIEPGESDLITVSFVFPCPAGRYARVATDVRKPDSANSDEQESSDREYVWKTRTIVDLGEICQKGTEAPDGAPSDVGGKHD